MESSFDKMPSILPRLERRERRASTPFCLPAPAPHAQSAPGCSSGRGEPSAPCRPENSSRSGGNRSGVPRRIRSTHASLPCALLGAARHRVAHPSTRPGKKSGQCSGPSIHYAGACSCTPAPPSAPPISWPCSTNSAPPTAPPNALSRPYGNGRRFGSSLVVETGDSVRDGAGESVGVSKGAVGELMLLKIAPASFDIVQFGGVFRQPFEGQPGALGKRLCGQLAGVDRPVVEHRDQGPGSFGGAVGGAELVEQGDKVGGALGGAGMYEKLTAHRIKGAEHRPLFRLAGRLNTQLGAAPSPAARQIGMRERLGFVKEHQIDCPCSRLGFQIGEVPTAGRHRCCILAPFEGVARPAPGKPLWRNWCDSHRGEIAGPPRRAISAHRRGSVHPPSWRTSSFRIAPAIAPACGPILACCPGRGRRRSPATPPCAK